MRNRLWYDTIVPPVTGKNTQIRRLLLQPGKGTHVENNREIILSDCDDGLDMSEKKITGQLLKMRTILISGEINKRVADRVMKQLLIMEGQSDEEITVFIDSPGGDADAGFAIFDMIRFVKPVVRTVCCGLTASAGALILLAATKENRYSMPNARILIHQPLGGTYGSATEILIQTEQIVKLRQRINEVIAEETGQDFDKVAVDTDRDCWLSGEEAKTYGLIHKVIATRSELG